MPNMKKVNVSSPTVIYNLPATLLGYHANIEMSEEDIFKCLTHVGTTVDEVLEDGSTIRLNLANYKHNFSKPAPVVNNTPVAPASVKEEEIPKDAAKVAVKDTEKHDAPVDDGSNAPEAFETDAEGIDATTDTAATNDTSAVNTAATPTDATVTTDVTAAIK